MNYDVVIGLEVHIELSCNTKIFCRCPARFGERPNVRICPVCAGLPGSLPVLNESVLDAAILLGLALGCEIAPFAKFDRKNYVYPDNPQNYQITQFYEPIARKGSLLLPSGKRVGIHELHMEDDAGKLDHEALPGRSLVDYNRSGIPLIEIVSEPELSSAKEAAAYLEQLRDIAVYLGISDCKMQEGSMRADVNLSLKEQGRDVLGVRTEMKNLNSYRSVIHAIEAETERQAALLQAGKKVEQQTRKWDEKAGRSYPMRSKEETRDYRYFPEPDLLPIPIEKERIERIRQKMPALRTEKVERYISEYHLSEKDSLIITQEKPMAELFEKTIECGAAPQKAANWLMGETMRLMRETGKGAEDLTFSPAHLASLIRLTEEGRVNSTVAKEVFEQIFFRDADPEEYIREHGLETISDGGMLEELAKTVIAGNPKSVADYRGGKKQAFGYLMGQLMKEAKGKADPGAAGEALRKYL